MFCRIGVVNSFAKFTGKRLCLGLGFSKVAGWKTSQNSREKTSAGVSFLIKLLSKKIPKFTRALLCRRLFSSKIAGWENLHSSQENACARASLLIKLKIGCTKSTSDCWYTFNFYWTAYNKIRPFAPFSECAFTHYWKSGKCLYLESPVIASILLISYLMSGV